MTSALFRGGRRAAIHLAIAGIETIRAAQAMFEEISHRRIDDGEEPEPPVRIPVE
ncbi:MAG TPA: hypothetical protein VHM94_02610 [Acidimicrobiia bacterium]|nr:hypothetical protein [Acidimicrobiia bacterium]